MDTLDIVDRSGATPGWRRTVVLADDDESVRSALVDLLGDVPNLRVVAAGADADDAISMCRAHHPDVLVVDVNMPAGGGARATEVVTRELPATVVVALSANADRVTRRRMEAAGADAFVAKGDVDRLIGVVTSTVKATHPR